MLSTWIPSDTWNSSNFAALIAERRTAPRESRAPLLANNGGTLTVNQNEVIGGDLTVNGVINKGSDHFKIDHPLDPEHKFLSHSVIESPEMKNLYDGIAVLDQNGEAMVQLPNWFEALNRDFRYQLTCIGDIAPVFIADEVRNNTFRIAGGKPGLRVSWQVTGVRRDAFAVAHPLGRRAAENHV